MMPMAVRALTLTGIMLLAIPVTLTVAIALLYAGYLTLIEYIWLLVLFVIGICGSSFLFGMGIPMALWKMNVTEGEVQKIAKGITLSGIMTIAVGVVLCLVIVLVVDDSDGRSDVEDLTFSVGILASGVIFGLGIPMIILGIILGWVSPQLYAGMEERGNGELAGSTESEGE